ncbi:family 20 glycosylhydrolase [Yinghuangia seranimata]|uniref:family 20 glycosylhydrolase n=1 Tax=Yinghuangia seranimata TaxID=408067 RepID=UPI00248C7C75|nr:family 20 glycosylhydrolase [Yinghuangia seranimata]MDI2130898.1 family 20 glycosylhydrolase [Yinghuangia seranimata]
MEHGASGGLIPRPVTTEARPGVADGGGGWRIRAAEPALDALAATLDDLLAPHLGPRPTADGAAASELLLRFGEPAATARPFGIPPNGAASDEAYSVTVTERGVECVARTPEGVFRAATSAAQLIAASAGRPACRRIDDAPRYAWRGLMVDPARGFLTPAELRRIVDLAALYKLNVLHLHLTDNEGWRLRLPGVPELAAAPDEPAYTADEFTALQEYAAARFVTVVPEIDLPGHCAAVRSAFPGLAVPGVPDEHRAFLDKVGAFASFTPPLDVTDPDTSATVERVVKEVCALTRGPYVHIGADEAFGMDADTYAASVRRLRALVRAHGKQPVAWQESARAGVEAGDIVQYWTDPSMLDPLDDSAPAPLADILEAVREVFAETADDVPRALAGGARVLLSPNSHLYLDRPYRGDIVPTGQAEHAAHVGFPMYTPSDTARAAAWDPAAQGVPEDRVAGVEATLFGETVGSFEDACLLLLPRLPGVAEAAWSGSPAPWQEYRGRLAHHARIWRERGLAHLAARDVDWIEPG